MANERRRSFPNVYSRRVNLATSGELHDFGFNALFVRIANRGADEVWLNFLGVAASSGDTALESSGKIEGTIPACSGVGVRTSTSTGNIVFLSALG